MTSLYEINFTLTQFNVIKEKVYQVLSNTEINAVVKLGQIYCNPEYVINIINVIKVAELRDKTEGVVSCHVIS